MEFQLLNEWIFAINDIKTTLNKNKYKPIYSIFNIELKLFCITIFAFMIGSTWTSICIFNFSFNIYYEN